MFSSAIIDLKYLYTQKIYIIFDFKAIFLTNKLCPEKFGSVNLNADLENVNILELFKCARRCERNLPAFVGT